MQNIYVQNRTNCLRSVYNTKLFNPISIRKWYETYLSKLFPQPKITILTDKVSGGEHLNICSLKVHDVWEVAAYRDLYFSLGSLVLAQRINVTRLLWLVIGMYSLLKNIVLVYHQEQIIKNIQHLIQIRLVWLDFHGV